LGAESLRTYNKIEPSSYSIKDRITQIIGFSALLLWLVVYAFKTINFNEYDDGSFIIKATFFLAAFSFTVSILLGIRTYYKTKSVFSNDPETGVVNAVKWFTFGLFVLMTPIPLILFPESGRFFTIYLFALTYAGKHVMGKISKNS
jgi:hypothetical protein